MRALLPLLLLAVLGAAAFSQEAPVDEDYLVRAKKLIEEGKLTEACSDLTKLYEADPKDPKLRYLLSVCQLMKAEWLIKGLANEEGNPYREWALRLVGPLGPIAASAQPGPSVAATVPPSPDQMASLEHLSEQVWLRVVRHVAVSPDGRYMAWITPFLREANRPVVRAVDLQTGKQVMTDVLEKEGGQGFTPISVTFLPGSDGVLLVSRVRGWSGYPGVSYVCVYHLPSESSVLQTTIDSQRTHHQDYVQTGSGRADGVNTSNMRPLPGSVWIAPGSHSLCLLRWDVSGVAEFAQWLKAGKGGATNSSLPVQVEACVTLERNGNLWDTERLGLEGTLVNQDGSLLLVPICRTLPSRDTAVCWAVVSLADPKEPRIAGFVPDWVSPPKHNPVFDEDVLTSARAFPTDAPIYAGGGVLIASEKDGSVVATGPDTKVIRRWEVGQVKLLGLETVAWVATKGAIMTGASGGERQVGGVLMWDARSGGGGGGGTTVEVQTIEVGE